MNNQLLQEQYWRNPYDGPAEVGYAYCRKKILKNSAENYAITDNYAYNESGINKIHRESTALYTTTQIACLDALWISMTWHSFVSFLIFSLSRIYEVLWVKLKHTHTHANFWVKLKHTHANFWVKLKYKHCFAKTSHKPDIRIARRRTLHFEDFRTSFPKLYQWTRYSDHYFFKTTFSVSLFNYKIKLNS